MVKEAAICPICHIQVKRGQGRKHLQSQHPEYRFSVTPKSSYLCDTCKKVVAPNMKKLYKHYLRFHTALLLEGKIVQVSKPDTPALILEMLESTFNRLKQLEKENIKLINQIVQIQEILAKRD